MHHRNHRVISLFLAATLVLSSFAMAGQLAQTQAGDAAISWQAGADVAALTLTVSGPGGFQYQESFDGARAAFSVFDNAGQALADGVYIYELRPTLALSDAERENRAAERNQDPGAEAKAWIVDEGLDAQSGSFAVAGGRIVNPELQEVVDTKATPDAAAKAQTFATDLIVQGSSCIGFDCTTTESFGFDTIRIKENNTRLNFTDTSASANFPGNDWTLVANSSDNGGANYFSIRDATAGKDIFTVSAGAPVASLYVKDDGKVGVGTANPALNLHIVEGNTPTLRLEQDGSDGFASQTWDIAGNETNFFIRDVNNSSKLPFKIKPAAPTDSLYVAADGNIGLGTDSPDAKLDLKGSGSVEIRIQSTDATTGKAWKLRSKGSDGQLNIINDSDSMTPFRIAAAAGNGLLELGTDATDQITVNGSVKATTFEATATGSIIPDYVFEEDYELMPLDELAAYIAAEKHLPRIPSAKEIGEKGSFDMKAMSLSLLEKVEELTLYTLSQQETIEALQARLSEVEGDEAR